MSTSAPESASSDSTVRHHYRTRQKQLVLDCLRAHPQEYLTARQIADELEARGETVGMATIYRNLDRLACAGEATRSTVEGSDGACYRSVSPEGEADEDTRFYLKCEGCGELVPIECKDLARFYRHFASEHHVLIDPVKTVLYGTCSACLERGRTPDDPRRRPHDGTCTGHCRHA